MRVRIRKHSHGIIEGVSLSHLLPGLVYEVPVSLGAWLISRSAAEEDVRSTHAIVISSAEASAVVTGGVTVSSPTDREDDREPPRRKRPPKKR